MRTSGLIVSRRPDNVALLQAMFETLGIEPLHARSCAEAETLLPAAPSVHLVLTDSELPDGDWLDVLDLAAGAQEKINVVVVSLRDDMQLYDEVMKHGAFDFVTEMFMLLDVIHIIRNAMDDARQAREMPTLVPSRPARLTGTAAGQLPTELREAE